MSDFSTPAIILRRKDFGDYDLIITFFTLTNGKISTIAKSAKKSTKRFLGILELFSLLEIVCSAGRGKGLVILKEAALKCPFSNIRSSIIKTAYASYWTEIVDQWMQEDQQQIQLYLLLLHAFGELDSGRTSEAMLSILFQVRFMALCGLSPNLNQCSICRTGIQHLSSLSVRFDLKRGGVVCSECKAGASGGITLSKGTIKQLQWVGSGDLSKASRIKFTPTGLKEGLYFLEYFVPYHIGKEPRSLTFLRQIRGNKHP